MSNYLSWELKSLVKIVIADEQNGLLQYAKRQIIRYLERITSAQFVSEFDGYSGDCIMLGYGESAKNLSLTHDDDLKNTDGFVVKTINNSLFIDGDNRGILYGMYEFLEQLGCRFFTNTCEKIPSIKNLKMPELNIKDIPVLEYREHFYRELNDNPSFSVKLRMNGHNCDIKDYMGGHNLYSHFVHTFSSLLFNPEEYFDTHPEYFSLINGVRQKEHSQLCLTNEDVIRISIEKVKKALRDNPKATIISISQNDSTNNSCTCEHCLTIDKKEESNAGSLIYFINKIAEAIEEEFPLVVIDTLAYQHTRIAPKYIKPRHNVCIRLCSIECCFTHEIDKCKEMREPIVRPDGRVSTFSKDMVEWSKICDRVYIWDYVTNFAHYFMPCANWSVLQYNIQFFVEHSAKGIFEQGNFTLNGSADLVELRAYLLAKLLWNPYCDINAHKKEFIEYYYGDAAPYITEYLDLCTSIAYNGDSHCSFDQNPTTEHVSFENLEKYTDILDKAEKTVALDAFRLYRVHKVSLSPRYVYLRKMSTEKHIANKDEIDAFMQECYQYGIPRIEEWVQLQHTVRALFEFVPRGTDYNICWNGKDEF